MKKDVNNFLAELSELTKKYKIVIGGCGCCGSPFLYTVGDEEKASVEGTCYDELAYVDNAYCIKNVYEKPEE